MSVAVAEATLTVPDGAGTFRTFADPTVGSDFSVSVPSDEAWRVWGASCDLQTSAVAGNRVPLLLATNNDIPLYVSGTNLNIQAGETYRVCWYDQEYFLPSTATDGVTQWFPVGIKAIWFPAGSDVHLWIYDMDTADQVSNVTMLIESTGVLS